MKLRGMCAFLLFATCILAQQSPNFYPQNYFRSPLDIPLRLSGNFGELRTNHFHAGIDIKTKGVVGHPVYVAADGYVSRIKVQIYGYGKVVYVTHPNGYTTVYAHLKSFNQQITRVISEKQYEKESYAVDMFLDSNQIVLKKGDQIALSGNSGGSAGAHLHFEIRETASAVPVNPLLFNFPVRDDIPPKIKTIVVYPMDEQASVNGKNKPLFLKAFKKAGRYQVDVPIRVNGQVALGIKTSDYLNFSGNRCGVYEMSMSVNDSTLYQYKTEKISFDETRYLNAHCDYAYRKKTGRWLHKLYTLPNDQLSIYPLVINNGVIRAMKDSTYFVHIGLKDVYQNSSSIRLKLKGVSAPEVPFKKPDTTTFTQFLYHQDNHFSSKSFKLYHPKGSFYQDIKFKFSTTKSTYFLSDLNHVHTPREPLHTKATMSIKCREEVKNKGKIVVVRKQGKKKTYLKANFINGWVNFKTKEFGTFYLDVDTVAPVIKTVNVFEGKNLSAQKTIQFRISDAKSGISTYYATINNQWVLFEYDYKKAKITFYLDNYVKKGRNTLDLMVMDVAGNQKNYSCSFIY